MVLALDVGPQAAVEGLQRLGIGRRQAGEELRPDGLPEFDTYSDK